MENIYPFTSSGFEGQQLEVQVTGFSYKAKILVDGQPAPIGTKKNRYVLKRNDGSNVEAELRSKIFVDPIPDVVIDGVSIPLTKPLQWYKWVLAATPFVLIIIGGALGGLCGGIGMLINGRIFRSPHSSMIQYLLVLLVIPSSFVAFLVLVTLFNFIIGRQ